MAEVEFPKPPKPSSSNWSLGSNQYASGRFPKVSISVPVERSQAGTDSKAQGLRLSQAGTDSKAQGLRLSQAGTDSKAQGLRPSQEKPAQQGLRLSQEKLLEETVKLLSQELSPPRPNPWISPKSPIPNPNQNQNSNQNQNPNSNQNQNPNSNSDPKGKESLLGKRKEPVQETGTNNNTDGLRMKLWEILNTGSQNPEATQCESPQIEGQNAKKPIQNQIENNQKESQKKGKLGRENIFSDPIETDSEGSKRVDERPVTRSLSLKKNSSVLKGGTTNGGSKRAKVEPRKLNFPKMPLVFDKNAKKHSPVVKEKTPLQTAKARAVNKRKNQNVEQKTLSGALPTSSNRTNKSKEREKENSWDFPVTPITVNNNNNDDQQKEGLSPKFGRNRRVLAELKGPSVNISNSGISLRRRKPIEPVEKVVLSPIERNTCVLNGSSAIKSNTGASMQRRKTVEKRKVVNSPVRSENMQLDPSSFLPPLVKKPVEVLESPVTSDDMQVENHTDSKGSFANKINAGAFMQRKNHPVEESPVTSDDLQPERNNESKGSFANKQNSGAFLQKNNRVEFPVSPLTSDDLQPERNNESKGSFANKINTGTSLQKNKRAEFPVSPLTSDDLQPEGNNESKGSFANKINAGASLQKGKFPVSPVTSNGTESPLFEAEINMSDYHKSPTFAINGTSSSKKGFDEEISVRARNPKFGMNGAGSSKKGLDEEISVRARNPKSSESFESSSDSDPDYELSEATRDSNDSFGKKLPNPSPMEDLDINSFLNKGYKRTDTLFSDLHSPIKSKSSPVIKNKSGSKSVIVHEKPAELFPPTLTGTEESSGSEEMVNEFPENDLASAVCQLALVLKKFKAKLKTKTNSKSAEILSISAEKIQQVLIDAQTQMQDDTRKFIGCSNSKRKHLESKFQEQAEKLKAIHEKFREEVNQQLMECKTSFEEFEAYQLELKGIAEKQKAVHRKLLSQVEEQTQAQLSDAEKKISLVHKEANKKMTGLKRVIEQWIPEGAD